MFWNRDPKKAVQARPKKPEAPHTVHGDVGSMLERCHREKTDIAVTLGHPPRVYIGQLSRVGPSTIVLNVSELEGSSAPVAGHICGAVFHHGPSSGGFLAAVREVKGSQIVLERPAMVTYVDARRSFRIPVSPSDGLEVQLASGGRVWSCPVIDLSRGGIGLRFMDEEALLNGTIVTLRFLWTGQRFSVTGLVARQVDNTVGLIFNVEDSAPEAEQLSTMISTIERSWLRREREAACP